MLRFFFLVLTISLLSSMDSAPLIPERFRSMPLHASSSWHLFITYMPSALCSPFLFHVHHIMINDLIPCLFLTIYTLLHHMNPMLIPHYLHARTICFPILRSCFPLVYKRL